MDSNTQWRKMHVIELILFDTFSDAIVLISLKIYKLETKKYYNINNLETNLHVVSISSQFIRRLLKTY